MASLKQFYADRYLHIRSFTLSFLIAAALCVVLWNLRSPEFFTFHWENWMVLLPFLGIYIGGVSAVFIHNATHGSFPSRFTNELAGYVAGIHQLWGYTGWKLIHLLHHQYSDDAQYDPHPPAGKGYWEFTAEMFYKSSGKVTERYREHWGESAQTKWLHRGVLITFLGMVACHLLMWYLLLGPVGFLLFYIPSLIANHLLFSHINYYAHPVNPETGETEASNMTSNLYYKLANLMWFGIYYHGNHHRKPTLFNPKYLTVTVKVPAEERKAA